MIDKNQQVGDEKAAMEGDYAHRQSKEQATLMDLRKEIETHLFLCNEKDR